MGSDELEYRGGLYSNQAKPRLTPFQELGNLDAIATAAYETLLTLVREGKPLRDIAMAYVAFMLARHNDNKFHAAKRLQVDRRSLQRWAKGDKAGGFGVSSGPTSDTSSGTTSGGSSGPTTSVTQG